MAISRVRAKNSQDHIETDIFSDSRSTSSFPLHEKILKADFKSFRFIARQQIANLMRQHKFHPDRPIYIYHINLIILDEKVFRNLNLDLIYKKKEIKHE